MDDNELQETLALLEAAGWEPQPCDTAIPYYDNAVSCGIPADAGDAVAEEYLMPRDFVRTVQDFCIIARGDSMEGAGIMEGDRLKVSAKDTFQDGDIVLAMIDDEYTLKTYCEDEDGTPWLVPQNERYEAYPLPRYSKIRIVGVVTEIIKAAPRVSYRSCMRLIRKAKQAAAPRTIGPQEVAEAIRHVAPDVKTGRQWYAVYRALADVEAVRPGDFQGFCQRVKSVVPEHRHLPAYEELLRMNVQSFARSVRLWDAQNAPVKGKRFDDYLALAQKTRQAIGA